MPYTIVNLGISNAQLLTLKEGHAIFVEPGQRQGNVPVPLTKAQVNRLKEASGGVKIRLAGPARKLLHGEGVLGDLAKKAAPVARKGVEKLLDYAAKKVPTGKAGAFKPLADGAVGTARNLADKVLDILQKKLTGAGVHKVIEQMGEGFFDDILKGVSTVAQIATPFLLKGRGVPRAEIKRAVDEQMGAGFFDDILKGVSTVAQIATPFLLGRGISGGRLFDDILKGVTTAAQVATPFLLQKGKGVGNKKKGKGFVLDGGH